jgi:hypothetical protein
MSAPDDQFKPALARDPETFAGIAPFFSVTFGFLPETLAVASAFLFFRTSTKMGTGRPIGHPRNFEHMIQATVIWKTGNAGFMLRACVTAQDISSFLLDRCQELSIIFFIFARQGKVW